MTTMNDLPNPIAVVRFGPSCRSHTRSQLDQPTAGRRAAPSGVSRRRMAGVVL